MMVQMNIERLLSEMGRKDIKVSHCSLSEAPAYRNDLFVVGLDIAPRLKDYPRIIVMKEIIAIDELQPKLEKALALGEKEKFHIK